MKTVAVVARCLVEAGVRTAFGVVGSGNFTVTNELIARGVRFVAARHEGGAACMADAYARVSGELSVCSVHQGPGLTNAVTGIAEAAKSRTPMIVLAGDTAAGDLRSNFRIEQDALVAAVGATSERVYAPGSAQRDTMRAIRRARDERRTVVLMLPLDVQGGEVPWRDGLRPEASPPPPAPSPTVVSAIIDELESSKRPVILAGRGAVLSGAGQSLERLAELTGALLATSAMGHGLFVESPWNIGISGGFSSPAAVELIREADLLLVFGAQLTRWTTRDGKLIRPRTRVVQVDIDVERLGASQEIDIGIQADAKLAADALTAEVERRKTQSNGRYRTSESRELLERVRWRDEPFDDASTAEHVDPRALTIALEEMLPAERTLVVDSGHFMGWPPMYLSVSDSRGFVFTQSFQSIGLGLADTIGAAVARPDRLTVGLIGDGGMLMGAAELETVARLRLPVLLVVYNDAAYGAEVHHFGPLGDDTGTVTFPDTDLAALARGAGIEAVTVRQLADLDAARGRLDDRGLPLLLDAKVAPGVRAHWLDEAMGAHQLDPADPR